MKKILLALCLLIGCATLYAEESTISSDYANGIYWTFTVDDWNREISLYNNHVATIPTDTSGAIAIPDTLWGYPVTSIAFGAFLDCDQLTSVSIPSSVEQIVTAAFLNCASLTSITVDPENQAFSSIDGLLCSKDGKTLLMVPTGLTTVNIPEGITRLEGAFNLCLNLTSVTIPSSVTEIRGGAYFYDKSILKSLDFKGAPPSVVDASYGDSATGTYLSKYADAWEAVIDDDGKWNGLTMTLSEEDDEPNDNPDATDPSFFTYEIQNEEVVITGLQGAYPEEIVIPSTLGGYPVTSIGDEAFHKRTDLTSVYIPSSVTSIGDYAFADCTGLTSVTISEGVTWIGFYTFSNCSGLESLTIPSSVETVYENAFSGCTSLTSLTIQEGVDEIFADAFEGCSGLTTVSIPESTEIGSGAFAGCSALIDFVVAEQNPYHCAVDGILYSKDKTVIMAVPGTRTAVIILDGTREIGEFAFDSCEKITEVVIPNSVETISIGAFATCSNLTSINIPSSL